MSSLFVEGGKPALCLRKVPAGKNVKFSLAGLQQLRTMESGQVPDQPVGGEYHQALIRHVRQHHHHIFAARVVKVVFPAPVPVVDGGFVAVVPVGNIKLAARKVFTEGRNGHRVVYHPEPVGHQAVRKLIPGGAGFCQVFDSGPGDMAFVLIEGIDLAEVAVRGLHQVETVGFCLAESLFVGQHHACGEILHPHPADQAL